MTEAATLFKEWSGYLKPEDLTQLESAYHFSKAAHEGQFRKSGEPYISHPLAVADILAQWHLDPQALTAALLHDVTEDTEVTKTEISRNFGNPVAELVDGVSKLDKVEFDTLEHAQAENFRKMLLAMARDVRVILIKLADRLHNMSRSKSGSSSTTSTLGRGPAVLCSTSAGSTRFSTFCKTPFQCHQGIELLLKRLQILLQIVHVLLGGLKLARDAPLVLQVRRDHAAD